MHYASLLEMQAELKDQSGRITVFYTARAQLFMNCKLNKNA